MREFYPHLEDRIETAGVVACEHCPDQIYIGEATDGTEAYETIMSHYDAKHDNVQVLDASDLVDDA